MDIGSCPIKDPLQKERCNGNAHHWRALAARLLLKQASCPWQSYLIVQVGYSTHSPGRCFAAASPATVLYVCLSMILPPTRSGGPPRRQRWRVTRGPLRPSGARRLCGLGALSLGAGVARVGACRCVACVACRRGAMRADERPACAACRLTSVRVPADTRALLALRVPCCMPAADSLPPACLLHAWHAFSSAPST